MSPRRVATGSRVNPDSVQESLATDSALARTRETGRGQKRASRDSVASQSRLPTPAELKSIEHEGRARMADAKRAAGFELDEVEKHALKLFPKPRTLTIEGYR